ncbi:hypothetical protein GCM10027446_14990 [Angustibacter peucedani]
MRTPTRQELPREALMLVAVVVVAAISPLLFDQPVVNWISALFVVLYIGSRVVRYAGSSR